MQRLLTQDRAIRGVRYRDPDGWHEVRAALTVTAGGRFSRVRKLAGLPHNPNRLIDQIECRPRVDRIRLEGCLGGLEPRERVVVTMTFAEDRTAEEISEALSLTAGNVRVIRHRALARLRSCVEGGEA